MHGVEDQLAFGPLLKRHRLAAGLTQEELAERAGLGIRTIQLLEHGTTTPQRETLERLLRALAVPHAVRAAWEATLNRRRGPLDLGREGQPTGRNPYKGLRAFTAADAGDFFGRDHVLDALLARVACHAAGGPRLVALLGPSGSGKSSLLLAGLLPRLRAGALPGSAAWCYLPPLTPGAHPLEALTLVLATALPDRSLLSLRADLGHSPRGLHLLASRIALGGAARVVLLVDQFEELFTLTADETERRAFIDLLTTAATEPDGSALVLLSMRADFYDRPMRYPALGALLDTQGMAVLPLSPEEARAAIERPAALPDVRLTFEAGLVDDVLADLHGQPGALPLLQFTLDALVAGRAGRVLTHAAYQGLGGVRGALARQAETTYAGLPDEEHRLLARALFPRLIVPGVGEQDIMRRRVSMLELVLPDARRTALLHAVIAAFVGARLLVAANAYGAAPANERSAPSPSDTAVSVRCHDIAMSGRISSQSEAQALATLEVSHEALIGAWPRLRGWIQEDRAGLLLHRRLTEAAREWVESGREEGLLYRGARLAAAQEWLAAGRAPALSASETAFLEAGEEDKRREAREAAAREARELAAALALARSERRRARGARILSGILSVVLVAALVATVVAVRQNRDAQAQRRQAEAAQRAALAERDATARANAALLAQRQATREAQSHDLATSALANEGTDPELSILLASAAVRLAPTGEAIGALTHALAATPLQATLRGHTGAVTAVAFSPDGRRLVTGGIDATTRIWDTGAGRLLATLRGFSQAVSGVAWSPNGALIAAASEDGTTRIWRAATGTLLAVLSPPAQAAAQAVTSVAFSPDSLLVATASMDGTARSWQARTGRLLRSFGQGDGMLAATFNPAGALLATTGNGYTVRLWNVRTGRSLPLDGAGDFLATNVHFDPSGAHLLGIGYDGPSRIWTVATGKLVGRLVTPGASVSAYDGAYSPDGSLIVTAGADSAARVWRVATGRLVSILRGATAPVAWAAFSPDGGRILTLATDHTARLWDTQGGQLLLTLPATIETAAFSPDGALIATGSGDGTVRLWGAQRAPPVVTLPESGAAVYAEWAGAAPARVAAGLGDALGIWDARSGRLMRTIREPGSALAFFITNADGSLVATAGFDAPTLYVRQTATGRLLYSLPNLPGLQGCWVRFSTDGTLLYSVGCNGEVGVWQARTGTPVAALHHVGTNAFMSISPDHRLALISSQDGLVRLWDLRTGRLARIVLRAAHFKGIGHVFSPDGALTVTSAAGITRIWEVRSSRLVATLPTGPLDDAEFDAGGRRLVTAGADGSAKVWDARAGTLLAALTGHTGPVSSASFSPDGRWIVTSSGDQTVRFWDARTGALMEMFGIRLGAQSWAQWSTGGGSVLVSSQNGAAYIVTCDLCRPLPTLLAMADARVGRQLTPLERAAYMYGIAAQ